MEIFPELEHRKTGSRKIYHTEAGSRKIQRSGDEAAAGSGKLQILPQTDCQMEIYLQREVLFEVQIGEMKRVELAFRNANLEQMLENISIPEFTLRKEDGSTVKASELTADGKHILAFLEEEKEPTEHILNEMMEQEEAFSRYANRIIFVVKSKKALETPTLLEHWASLEMFRSYMMIFQRSSIHWKKNVRRSG